MDYRSCGSPDMSYHGTEAWRPAWEPYNRHIGIMLNGAYGREEEEKCWYIAINMHWESHDFAMPRLPKGQIWRRLLTTEVGNGEARQSAALEGQSVRMAPRSIALYCSEKQSH